MLLVVAVCPAAKAAVLQQYAYFSWTPSGAATHSAQLAGVNGAILFTTTGDDVLYPRIHIATESNFISRFAAEVPSMFFENSAADPAADALAQVAFTPALPAGARLMLIDVDQVGAQERVQIARMGGSLTLLEQIESRASVSSAFPTWNPTTGILQSVRSNQGEVSIFDVSGVRSLNLWYRRGIGGGGLSGSNFIIALPVPEPTGLTFAALLVASIAVRRAC